MWLCAQRLRRKMEEERKRSSRLDKTKDIKRTSEEWWLLEHIALAPSVGQIRQKPTTTSLSARTPMGLDEILSLNTISLFDRSAIPTVIQQCGASVHAQNESVMLTVAQGQRTPYFVNGLKNMCTCACVRVCVCVCVCSSSCGCCATD